MTKTLNIAIAGLGTVGAGVVKIIQENAALLRQRSGMAISLVAVSARDKNRNRDLNLQGVKWVDDPVALADEKDVDVVVELIGGAEGVARALCQKALQNGKHVVTANKALIAHHGVELAKLAEQHKVQLCFEAAVAGGIPIIKTLKEGLAANRYKRICGIMNGTCNFILTSMQEESRDFDDVLQEAQEKGYAEADPTFDIDGIDTAHKLAIITSLAYGVPVNIEAMYIEGIRNVTLSDIRYALELGYKIKLLGICGETPQGIEQRVHPCMIPIHAPLASVDGVYNAVFVEGDRVGKTMFEGPGAGQGATASAVVADVLDIASGRRSYAFNVPAGELKPRIFAPMDAREGAYYIRLTVVDKPGVMADIANILRDERISMESLLQKARKPNEPVDLVLTTHEVAEKSMQNAINRIKALDTVVETPHIIRMETL